jgi:chemotaxis methyl-accepting protein methylase
VSPKALAEAAVILEGRAGLAGSSASTSRLRRCLEEGARAAGVGLDDYLALLRRDPQVLQHLLDVVTVQHSCFFRDPAQLQAFASEVLPGLPGPVSVWSAGCGNGQEAYTLAMLLEESGRDDWSVWATDLSSRAVARTRSAVYSDAEVNGLAPWRRKRHLERVEGGWRVKEALRRRVQVQRHNLAASSPPMLPGPLPAVFCRNVLIYFDHRQLAAFLDRLAAWMPPGGYLFLGYSESLWQVETPFQLAKLGGSFGYRRTPVPGKAPSPAPETAGRRRAGATPSASRLLREGEREMAAGNLVGAVRAFRQAAYLEPDHPIAHLQLGMSLETAGDLPAATRAYSAARRAAGRCDAARAEEALEGYRFQELVRLIEAKLEVART